jgi:hypothetical protein
VQLALDLLAAAAQAQVQLEIAMALAVPVLQFRSRELRHFTQVAEQGGELVQKMVVLAAVVTRARVPRLPRVLAQLE